MILSSPFILAFGGVTPRFSGEPQFCGAGSSVLGRVTVGARAVLGPGSVLRGDGHDVSIGDDVCIGESATVHIAHERYPAVIGSRVSVGRNAVVHACSIGNDCVIEQDAVVLDGAVVESNVLIEAGTVVYPRSVLASGWVYSGSPAKVSRALTESEFKQREARIRESVGMAAAFPSGGPQVSTPGAGQAGFVAGTASLHGRVRLFPGSSVFFSCILDAGPGSVVVHDNTNIQDNTRIHCAHEGVVIGANTTIGHNVDIQDCRIGERALIGIGSAISTGTRIDDDVLLAAGSTTGKGQVLEGGWLWAGRPARPVSKLDDAKRGMMRDIITQYCAYADAYHALQRGNAG